MHRLRLACAAITFVALTSGTLTAAGPGLASGAGRVSTGPDNNWFASNVLTGVSALSPSDVWAVGNHLTPANSFQPVIRHFDGQQWTRVGSLPLHGASGYPVSVQALSDDDVWVGLSSLSGAPSRVAHWDGSAWSVATLPGGSEIYHVWAADDSDVWAVGEGGQVEHYDGHSWSSITTPAPSGTELFSVSGSGPDDVWFAGRFTPSQGYSLLLMHWDGSTWTMKQGFSQPGETGLEGVVVLSPTDAWAAGWYDDSESGQGRGLTLHWNGKHWADSYQSVLPGDYLYAVTAASPTDVWVTGHGGDGDLVAAHWNGRTWRASHPRSPGSEDNEALAISADGPNDVWLVGCWNNLTQRYRLIEHDDGTGWTWVHH